jgi:hypothetical protein
MFEGKQSGARAFRIRADAPIQAHISGQRQKMKAAAGAILGWLGGIAVALTVRLEIRVQLAANRPKYFVQFAHGSPFE